MKRLVTIILPLFAVLIALALFIAREHNSFEGEEDFARERGFDRPDGFAEYFKKISTPIGSTKESEYPVNYKWRALKKAQQEKNTLKAAQMHNFDWVQRGPGNVGGRTRTILIDWDDNTGNTWFAGSASGGVWKTTNAGNSWSDLTPELPNLATSALAMATTNTNIIYAGTGEGYGGFGMVAGSGIYRSIDKGMSWNLMAGTDTTHDLKYINKIWVSPVDENIVVFAANTGIYRTTDAFVSWQKVFGNGHVVQDIAQNPLNPQVLYAGVNSLGIYKSVDAGSTWKPSFNGIGTGRRFSVCVSPVDTSYIYTTVEVNSQQMDIYLSDDGGKNWRKHYDRYGEFVNFQGVQGWFNNILAPHPYERNKLLVGGVYLGMVEFKSNITTSNKQIVRVDTIGTGKYMDFINFGGTHLSGGLASGLSQGADVEPEDFTSVEIRFGSGLAQMAHRFTVPEGEGPGVPQSYYTYEDYVEVPFEAWDTETGRQLMVSFRDQDRDGTFNLIEREFDDDISGREYIFIHADDYNAGQPLPDIAIKGGHYYRMLYFVWPALINDAVWYPDNLPESVIKITYGAFQQQDIVTTVLSDDKKNNNLHVDHHDLKIIPIDKTRGLFTIIDANDGGIGVSYNSGQSWEQMSNGYITTQFYGVAKKPGANEYIGGMQDNGTWQSPEGEQATVTSEYKFRVEGDGFETLWHPWYPKRIIGSSYNNAIKLSIDGGETWEWITNGLRNDGPFVTRLSHSLDNPNLIFCAGSQGVYRHLNFGVGRYPWQQIDMPDGWAVSAEASSAHQVEVSLAAPSVVWAGEGMYEQPNLSLFYSTNYGQTFSAANNWDVEEMGFISGLATHPSDSMTAYALFSLPHKPKILRTTNMGKTWEDISGFGTDSSSSNGFPDVMVHSLLVMPFDNQILWAGTEIGLFESTNNGQSWHIAENGFPAVSVWEMKIIDHEIVIATHGRGIWTSDIHTLGRTDEISNNLSVNIYPNPAVDQAYMKLNGVTAGEYNVSVIGLDGKVYQTQWVELSTNSSGITINVNELSKGTYIISISGKGQRVNKKLIVQ